MPNQHTNGWTDREIAILKKHIEPKRTHFQIFIECRKDGLEKTFPATQAQVIRIKKQAAEKIYSEKTFKKYQKEIEKQFLIGYLDIESFGGFEAGFGSLLSWALKERDGRVLHDCVTTQEQRTYKFDRRIISTLCEQIPRFDYLYTFYGGDYHFDIPMVRTKAVMYGVPFPGYRRVYAADLRNIAKQKLSSQRYSLDQLCRKFGIAGKTHLDPEVWKRAFLGSPPDLDQVVAHNIADVRITERFHKKIETFFGNIRSSI